MALPFKPGASASQKLLVETSDLVRAGKTTEAVARLRAALAKKPGDADISGNLAVLLLRIGQPAQAIYCAESAYRANPEHVQAIRTMAAVTAELQRLDEAERFNRKLLELDAEDALASEGLALVLEKKGRLDDAAEVMESAISRGPTPVSLRVEYAAVLNRLGCHEEAKAILRAVQLEAPMHLGAAHQLAAMMNYDAGSTPEQTAAAHRRYGMLLADHVGCGTSGAFRHTKGRSVESLHIGVISPDFGQHSVSFFALPLCRAIKAAGWKLSLYDTGLRNDQMTERYRLMADRLTPVMGLNSLSIANRINQDGVDVLIELAGLTIGHSQSVMALKPAPLQITAIGYPATTGNRAIDYRLVDAATDPPGSEGHCVEKLLRLDPVFLCYEPPVDAPEPRVPIDDQEVFSFGSFNSFHKLSTATLDLWRRVLERVPDARLTLKGTMVPGARAAERFRRTLRGAGLPMDRVDLLEGTQERVEHLRHYHKVHVALDTYPYHGTTTTCEALLMGVPLVTLAGASHVSRVGVSLLQAVGMGELVATSSDHYVEIAAGLALDRPRLRALQASARTRLLTSPATDEAHYSRQLHQRISEAWAASQANL